MVMSFEESKQFEELKQGHKKEMAEIQMTLTEHEHDLKMERLRKQLEIVKAGGKLEGGT